MITITMNWGTCHHLRKSKSVYQWAKEARALAAQRLGKEPHELLFTTPEGNPLAMVVVSYIEWNQNRKRYYYLKSAKVWEGRS